MIVFLESARMPQLVREYLLQVIRTIISFIILSSQCLRLHNINIEKFQLTETIFEVLADYLPQRAKFSSTLITGCVTSRESPQPFIFDPKGSHEKYFKISESH